MTRDQTSVPERHCDRRVLRVALKGYSSDRRVKKAPPDFCVEI